MITVGYMYKKVLTSPQWLGADAVVDIFSVSDCISKYFADYINHWRHNEYWLFDSPEVMEEIAAEMAIDLSDSTLFYYEMYEQGFDGKLKQWVSLPTTPSSAMKCPAPINKILQGFDVVTYTFDTSPEHSPLSCNALAKDIPVNQHCLFTTFDEAKSSLEMGLFENSEPGPYRIFAVYTPEMV